MRVDILKKISIASISYGNSVHLSVMVSRSGTILSPGEIEASSFRYMIAYVLNTRGDRHSDRSRQ